MSTSTELDLINDPQSENGKDTGLLIDELATMPERAILDETKLAEVFRVHERTIRRWVLNGVLPPPAEMGNRTFWMAGRILNHIERRIVEAENEAETRQLKIAQYAP